MTELEPNLSKQIIVASIQPIISTTTCDTKDTGRDTFAATVQNANRAITGARSGSARPEPEKGTAALVSYGCKAGCSEESQGHSPCEHME